MKFLHYLFKALRVFFGSPKCRLTTYIVFHVVLIFFVAKRLQNYAHNGTEMAKTAYELRTLLTDRDKWNQRSLWISQEVPRFIRHDKANDRLVKLIKQAARNSGSNFELREVRQQHANTLTSTKSAGRFEKVSVEISFTGSEKEVVSFINRLQKPENFVGIDHLAIDLTDYGDLSCEIKATQWFIPPWRQVENITVEVESS